MKQRLFSIRPYRELMLLYIRPYREQTLLHIYDKKKRLARPVAFSSRSSNQEIEVPRATTHFLAPQAELRIERGGTGGFSIFTNVERIGSRANMRRLCMLS